MLDLRLIPWLCLLYLICFLDRTNIGNARLEGLEDSLKLTPGEYNATLSIFFVSYSLSEPLTNVLLKRLRPSIFIPAISKSFLTWEKECSTYDQSENFSSAISTEPR